MTHLLRSSLGLRLCIFSLSFLVSLPLTAQSSQSDQRVFCTTQGPNMCINPTDDFIMTLQGCASGQENLIGPVFTINVPPGEDFEFQLHSHPNSILRSFFIITDELFTPPFTIDICDQQNDDVFVGPEFIEPNDSGTLTTVTIPSAVVDQMVSASQTDGRVFLISKDCISGIENFASAEFTRNPVGTGSLDLQLVSAPKVIDFEESFLATQAHKGFDGFEIEFSVTNNGSEALQDVAFFFDAPGGGIQLSEIEVEGQLTCQASQICFFNIDPGQTVTIIARVFFNGIGRIFYFGQILSDRCEDRGRIDLETRIIDEPFQDLIATTRINPETSTEVVLTNRDAQDVDIRLQATDEDGIFADADALGTIAQTPLPAKAGNSDFRLAPGETKRFTIPASNSGTKRYVIFVRGNGAMLAQIRQQRRVDTRAGVSLQGSTTPMMRYDKAIQMSGNAMSYLQVAQASQHQIVLTNYNQTSANAQIVIRDGTTGAMIREITNILIDPLRILTFDLTSGDNNALIQLIADNGLSLVIENNRPGEFQMIPMRPRSSSRSAPGPNRLLGTTSKRQSFFSPSTLDTRYEASQYDLFLFPGAGQSVPPGMASFSYDFECGINPENSFSLPISSGNPDAAVSVTLPTHNQPRGGYGTFDNSEIVPAISWREGTRQFWFQPTKPVTSGRIFIPRITPLNDLSPQIADITFQIYSDTALMLPVAAFNRAGELQSFGILDLEEPGANHLCHSDLGVDQDTAYLEFQVPEDHGSDVWFDAFATAPVLDYKDQLPTLPIPGVSTLTTIQRVLDAWDGGDSCLGPMPDMMALVDFVNQGFICPNSP